MNSNTKLLGLATVTLLVQTSCSSEAKLAGQSGSRVKPPKTSNVDSSQSPLFDLVFDLKAKDVASGNLVKPEFQGAPVNPADVSITASSLPSGHYYDGGTGAFKFQTDIQDIDAKMSFTPEGVYSGTTYKSNLSINVLMPSIAKNQCFYRADPVVGAVTPVEKWHWSGWVRPADSSQFKTTYSSPVVGDLNNDGNPEVVVIASTDKYHGVNGTLSVLDGANGTLIWNSMSQSPAIAASASTTPAIIDLDKDGFGEIIFASFTNTRSQEVIAIDFKTKAVKWRFSAGFVCGVYCMPSVADINGDGDAEVVIGNVILKKDGSLLAAMSPTPHTFGNSAPSIADLDPSIPGLEIVVNGSQLYRASGTRIWDGGCVGFSGIGRLIKSGELEIVCISGGTVQVFNKSGVRRWIKNIPVTGSGNQLGGAPNIGNFTGDDDLEIGTAGGDFYVVYDKDGDELWRKETVDRSSMSTGSTVFDFNGDGKVEVVYNDEQKLRLYNGETGAVLWETENPSGTLWEYPVVANIDDDSSVELIVSSPGRGGVRVFEDSMNLWTSSSRVWNQYSFYSEIVDDNLRVTTGSIKPVGGFRVNKPGIVIEGDKILLHDLAVTAPMFPDADSTATSTNLSLLIVNQGQTTSPRSLNVELTDGLGNSLGSVNKAVALEPGAGTVVQFKGLTINLAEAPTFKAKVNFNTSGVLQARECNYENNTQPFNLTAAARVTAP